MKRRIFKVLKLLRHPLLCGLVVYLFMIVAYLNEWLSPIDRLGYDIMLAKRGNRTPPKEVLIVDVDEKSLRAMGRWPWPRAVIASLISKLDVAGAKVIAFDMTFSEFDQALEKKQLENVLKLLEGYELQLPKTAAPQRRLLKSLTGELQSMISKADSDQVLSKAISESRAKVILGYFMHFPSTGLGQTLDARVSKADLDQRLSLIRTSAINASYHSSQDGSPTRPALFADRQVVDLVVPIAQIAQATPYFGYFNNQPDPDNTSRRYYPFYRIGEQYFPSLGLQAAMQALSATAQLSLYENDEIKLHLLGDQGRLIGEIPFNSGLLLSELDATMFINYYGAVRQIRYLSAVDVISGNVKPDLLRNKTVFIGTSSPAVFDLVKVPLTVFRTAQTPGVEVHASVAANILDHHYLVYSDKVLIFILIVPLLMILLVSRLGPLLGLISIITVICAEIPYAYYALTDNGEVIYVAGPTMALLAIYLAITFVKYQAEESQRRFIKKAFEHYLSPTVIQQIVDNPAQLELKGERRNLTILFTDIRDFSGLSEQLTAVALHDLLTAFLTPMTDIILNNQGTLDKYIGDAIMAFYGAPIKLPDHPRRACQSALEMCAALKVLNRQPGFPPLEIGIGINTGDVSVGNMGSTRLFDYTVLGDGVNLASRLEGITKRYGTSIIVSEATYLETKEAFQFRELDRVQVKGKLEVVTIFELFSELSTVSDDDREFIRHFQEGLSWYREQSWAKAVTSMQHCLRINPQDRPAKLYLSRLNDYSANPPVGVEGKPWDGVYRFEVK